MADIRRAAANNIYTVLAFIAAAVLAFGVIYLFIRYGAVFGGMPFTARQSAMIEPVTSLMSLLA